MPKFVEIISKIGTKKAFASFKKHSLITQKLEVIIKQKEKKKGFFIWVEFV
jgi:hypothetical protein